MTCDRSCQQWTEPDLRGRRKALPRRYPLDRMCCCLALLAIQSPQARPATLQVIAAQVSAEHARAVSAVWAQRR